MPHLLGENLFINVKLVICFDNQNILNQVTK